MELLVMGLPAMIVVLRQELTAVGVKAGGVAPSHICGRLAHLAPVPDLPTNVMRELQVMRHFMNIQVN